MRKIKLIVYVFILFIMLILLPSKSFAITIVLDPGHGGKDSGATYENFIERDINLKLANYLKEYLDQYSNTNVILTRQTNDDNLTLEERAMIARNNKADLFVSIHVNSCPTKEVEGAEVFCTYRTELPKYNQEMTKLGKIILKYLDEIGLKNRGVINDKKVRNLEEDPKYYYYDGSRSDYYGIIRYAMKGDTPDLGPDFSDGSGISTVLIEHGYISNEHDRQFINSNENIKKIAKADADAISEYFNLSVSRSYSPVLESLQYYNNIAFDPVYYANRYSDLKNAFGYDAESLYNHWKKYGINEKRIASPVYDPVYYISENEDVKNVYRNDLLGATEHFLLYGINEGRKSSEEFNINYYKENYSDLRQAFGNNNYQYYYHYIKDGIREHRVAKYPISRIGYIFNSEIYAYANDDVRNVFGYDYNLLLEHYIKYGIREGRISSICFDVDYYILNNPDVKITYNGDRTKSVEHFLLYGYKEKRKTSPIFDINYYLNNNLDLKFALGENNYNAAYTHFTQFGINEFRVISESFNCKAYKNKNLDLSADYGENSKKYYYHYLVYGRYEKRIAR